MGPELVAKLCVCGGCLPRQLPLCAVDKSKNAKQI